jgi:hypothetical protein
MTHLKKDGRSHAHARSQVTRDEDLHYPIKEQIQSWLEIQLPRIPKPAEYTLMGFKCYRMWQSIQKHERN